MYLDYICLNTAIESGAKPLSVPKANQQNSDNHSGYGENDIKYLSISPKRVKQSSNWYISELVCYPSFYVD